MFKNTQKRVMGNFVILVIAVLSFSNLQAAIGHAQKTFKTPATHPTGMTFDGEYIWLADKMTYKIYRINPQNGKVVKTIQSPGFDPTGLAWDGKLLWCADGKEGWIYGINVETEIAEKILESNSSKPGGLAFDGNFFGIGKRLN